MNRTKWALLFLLGLAVQPGICAQNPASRESADDHLDRANQFAGSGNLSGAIGEFRAAIHLDPSNASAHWGLAKALEAENPHVVVPNLSAFFLRSKMQGALKEYQLALKLDPKLRDDQTESAGVHVHRAEISLGADFGHWWAYPCADVSDNLINHSMDDAAAEYRIAILLDPDYVSAHVGLGIVLAKFHKTDEAIDEFRAAVRLDPHHAEAHLGLGKLLEKKGKLQDALQEYAGALSLKEGKAKYEKLSSKLGMKKEPSQLLVSGKNSAAPASAGQPASAAARAPEPASEPDTPASEQAPVPAKTDPEDALRSFKSYYIKSDTIYLHREMLQTELQKRREFSAWELTPAEDLKAADVLITITLPFLTWEWNYRMVHQPSGTEVGMGKVSAAVEKTAAPQLAAMIVERIRSARPLPASFQNTQSTPQVLLSPLAEKGKSWDVRYIWGSVLPHQDTPVTLTLNRERMTVRNSKTLMFSAPVLNLSAFDSRTEVHRATEDWEEAWDKMPEATLALFIFALPVFWAGEGIAAPIKSTDHFVRMYWIEDGATKSAEFRVRTRDTKSLFAELNKVIRTPVEDLQQLSQARLKLIAEQFDASPIVELDRQVNVGWRTIAPGAYRLVVVPREQNLAEVYFFPASFQGGSFNARDVAALAVVELERRKTALEDPSARYVIYREQNGIAMPNQIGTSDLILHFTPVPLGFAK